MSLTEALNMGTICSNVKYFTNGLDMMIEMLTAKEMQTLLQVDRSTIYRMAESGRLPALKVGKQWRFPADQVDSWLQIQIAPGGKITSRVSAPQEEMAIGSLKAILPLECVQSI